MIAIGRLVDTPQTTKKVIVDIKPIMTVGFLPNLSEALPHGTAVQLWDSENAAEVMPAQ